tara:strand:- start:46 stop:738 length:693 start_codon:yes stop_codon:yes gene_type:complete
VLQLQLQLNTNQLTIIKDTLAMTLRKQRAFLPTDDLEVFDVTAEEFKEEFASSWAKGFDRIGSSDFTGQMGYYNYAISSIKEHGREIGATQAFFVHDLERVVNVGSNSSINCNEFLGTCSSNTRNQSYEVHEQHVIYMAKNIEKLTWGFQFRELTLAEKTEYSTNYGLAILMIRDGLPFYNAGIVPGDIVLSQDGNKISSVEDIKKLNISVFEIGRKGKRLDIEVTTSHQ